MMAAILQNLMDGSAPWSGAEGRGPQGGRPMSKGMESAHPAGRHASCLGSHVHYLNDTSSRLARCADQDQHLMPRLPKASDTTRPQVIVSPPLTAARAVADPKRPLGG